MEGNGYYYFKENKNETLITYIYIYIKYYSYYHPGNGRMKFYQSFKEKRIQNK